MKNNIANINSEVARRTSETEGRNNQLASENESLKRRINDTTNDLNIRISSYDQKIVNY
jgi:hypothetical protein